MGITVPIVIEINKEKYLLPQFPAGEQTNTPAVAICLSFLELASSEVGKRIKEELNVENIGLWAVVKPRYIRAYDEGNDYDALSREAENLVINTLLNEWV